MKKFYPAFLLSLISFAGAQAQLTQANHAPANGDTWSTYACDTAGVKPGNAGTGQTWNYASITVSTNVMVSYNTATVSAVPAFPAANVSVTASNTENVFYNSSVNSLLYHGGKRTSQGNSFTLGYTSPAVAAFYPMTMNTASAATTSGTVDVSVNSINASGTFSGTSNVIADATGTMTLPGASQTFTGVTRVAFTQNINFTVSTILGPVNGTMTELTYDYYQAGIKAPVFTIANFTVELPAPLPTTVEKIVTRNKDAVGISTGTTVSVSNVEQHNEVKIFPNPANQSVSITTDSKNWTSAEIFDLTGRHVETKLLTDGKASINTSEYKEGLYIYTLKNATGSRTQTGKIAVTH